MGREFKPSPRRAAPPESKPLINISGSPMAASACRSPGPAADLGVYLPRHYVSLGIGFVGAASLLAARHPSCGCIDVFFDPLLALIMDRTKTPIGRYRPWLMLGAPIMMLGVYKVLMPSGHITQFYLVLWLVVSLRRALHDDAWAGRLAAVLASDYDDRARVYGWTQAMSVIGSVAFLLLPLFTHGKIVARPKPSACRRWADPHRCRSHRAPDLHGLHPRKARQPSAAAPRFSLTDYGRAIARPSMRRLSSPTWC